MTKLTIGLFGIGLGAYWTQFEDLRERLQGYLDQVSAKLTREDVRIVELGLIDSVDQAFAAGRRARREEVDLLVLHLTTYALSATVLPLVRKAGVPMLVLSLQPSAAIDYAAFNALPDRAAMTGEWLAYCATCPAPEIANVLQRAGLPFFQVTGVLDEDDECWREVEEWIGAARVACALAENRLGLMGHYYSGMLDIYTDLTLQLATFGGHVEILEVDELSALRREVTGSEIAARVADFRAIFDVQPDCSGEELERAARTSVALDRLAEAYRLGSLAYFYQGVGVEENADTMSSIIVGTSLLTGRGIPVAGEYEVKNAQAMKILDLFGAGGSFTECYAVDFADDVVLMGHDGPGHVAIAEGLTKVRPLTVYHGKVGRGLSVEMSVRHGPVTLFSVVETGNGKLKFLIAEGESVTGPTLKIGNTNSRYRFPLGARGFVDAWNRNGPAHHCAVGTGHLASRLEKLGRLLNVESLKIC